MEKINRRRFFTWFGAGAALGTAGLAYSRFGGYADLPGWSGKVLSKTEAQIIMAACEVILPENLSEDNYLEVAKNVDSYLYTFSEEALGDVHLMFSVVEHLTPISLHLSRFTKLDKAGKNDYLYTLDRIGSQLRLVYKGIRDLCMLGYYQQNKAWEKLKYGGPIVGQGLPMRDKYRKLLAQSGTMPQSLI